MREHRRISLSTTPHSGKSVTALYRPSTRVTGGLCPPVTHSGTEWVYPATCTQLHAAVNHGPLPIWRDRRVCKRHPGTAPALDRWPVKYSVHMWHDNQPIPLTPPQFEHDIINLCSHVTWVGSRVVTDITLMEILMNFIISYTHICTICTNNYCDNVHDINSIIAL